MLLVTAFAACSPDAPVGDEKLMTVVGNGESDWRIIIPKSATLDEKKAAELIRDAISAASGVTLEIGDDYVNERRGILPGEHEILIGDTARDESRAVSRRLRTGDRTVTVSGGKLIVLGGSSELTLTAAGELAGSVTAEKDGTVAITAAQCRTVNGEYSIPGVTVDGIDLRDLTLVYPVGNTDIKSIVTAFSDHFRETAGMRLAMQSDNRTGDGRRLIFTASDGDGASTVISADGGDIRISGDNVNALRYAVAHLIDTVFSADASNGDAIEAKLCGMNIVDEMPRVSVMSFNILCDLPDISRVDKIVSVVRDRMPDSIGFQEVTEQLLYLLKQRLGDEYDWVGEMNDDSGQRWRNAIFYRRSTLELVSTETRWLSATPSRRSKFPESGQFRIATTAYYRCRGNGIEWAHVNTHLAYEDAARVPQIKALFRTLDRIEVPFALTGDFNIESDSRYYPMLLEGNISDSKYLTADRDDKSTYAVSVIDYCFLSKGDFNVYRYRVDKEIEASDHYPVYVELSFLHNKK